MSVEPADVVGPLTRRGRSLIDATGRTVIVHGTNMVNKSEPYYVPVTAGWLGTDDIARLRRDGLNGVRLGVRPEALMPAPGVVDHRYLDRIAEAVEALQRAGIWVLLDLHQDVFDGMPSWATSPAAAAEPTLPPALTVGQLWFLSYLSPRSIRQWDDWWSQVPLVDGRSGVDLYGDGVAALAARFGGRPDVIGIDLMNEPFPGSPFFACLVGDCSDRYAQVAAAYRSWTARVRQVAPSMGVWWAPFNWGQPYTATPPPGPGVGYTFHSYCLGTDGGAPVRPDPVSNTTCRALYDANVDAAVAISQRWDVPALMGEFGASDSPLNTTRLVQRADEQLMSWMHWHWGTYPEVVRTDLVRTYAQATAGQPLAQRFDPETGDFEFRYRPDPAVTAPTSIVVPTEAYPAGYTAAVVGGSVTSAANSGRLTVRADGTGDVVVTVRRAATS